jgi:hypothetical protein
MNHRLIFVLLGIVAFSVAGCANLDNEMASHAVDMPKEIPLSEQPPVLTGTSTPAPHDSTWQ